MPTLIECIWNLLECLLCLVCCSVSSLWWRRQAEVSERDERRVILEQQHPWGEMEYTRCMVLKNSSAASGEGHSRQNGERRYRWEVLLRATVRMAQANLRAAVNRNYIFYWSVDLPGCTGISNSVIHQYIMEAQLAQNNFLICTTIPVILLLVHNVILSL